jgi:hypothetical protein
VAKCGKQVLIEFIFASIVLIAHEVSIQQPKGVYQMKKYYIVLCVYLSAFLLSACEPNSKPTEGSNEPVTTTLQAIPTTSMPVIVEEPGLKPARVTETGLKVGQCKQASADLKWMDVGPFGSAQVPACSGGEMANQPCLQEHAYCKQGGTVLMCHNHAPKTCYGWVYEKDIATGISKPMKDVNVDLWNMPLCMVGICNSLVGPVKTNEFGYFEMVGKGIPESTSVRAWLDGFYGVCGQDNKPSCIGGKCSTGDTLVDSNKWEIRPIQLMKITATSCR